MLYLVPMERPYKGRAIITDHYGNIDVVIPAKRQILVMLFLGFWLCGWLVGEGFALGALLGLTSFGGGEIFVSLFLAVWLIGWTLGGLFVMRIFFWMLLGKEVITLGQGRLTINKKGLLFSKPKTYDINEVKGLRVQETATIGGYTTTSRRSVLMNNGTIQFDYGMKTIKFGNGLEVAEGKHILLELKRKGYLYDRNFDGQAPSHFY